MSETEFIPAKCPLCGEEIIGDSEEHQYHGDQRMPCPKCKKWLKIHMIARFVAEVDKEMQEYVDTHQIESE